MSQLNDLVASYRVTSKTEREKGTYFEELIRTYFRHEPRFADLYSEVWLYSDWAKEIGGPEFGLSAKDTGIDLVARTQGTGEYHAIQCKCYAADHRVQKGDIDSFFTASGQKPFVQRIIVTTTNDWSENAENSLNNQTPPVYKIDLLDLQQSQIDWEKYQPSEPPVLKPKFDPRPHQGSAINNTLVGFKSADRGKLIMACGTGKTFTSLKIAEAYSGKGKRVLFLVPSLSLLSQTLTEWTQQSKTPLHSFAVCSDSEVGKQRTKDDDIVQTFTHELRYPATTDAKRLAYEIDKRHDAQHMSVVFSTYHSIDVISRAQHLHGLGEFDLIICDEAHRTTGATFDDDKESNFVKIHDADFIRGNKRLYMTATPRIYGDMAKASAEKDSVTLCSMDDEALFGKQLHVITFSEAVQLKLLTDYKVLVLTISEDHVTSRLQKLLADENNQLKVDDAARIIGCWKALSKQGENGGFGDDTEPMKRAVAFCQVIERQTGKAKTHKVSSKEIAGMFQNVVDAYQEQDDSDNDLLCEAAHVDGTMNASEKEEKLQWLKAEAPPNTCRILSNVRCLSEGVDVPALDAVLFLTPRNSQVDVVQSVGRVMRNAPGKERGYVVLPVVIPSGMEPHEALNDNKVYKVVWDVLQALRSHDDTFDAFVNKLEFDGQNKRKMEVIAITDKTSKKSKSTSGEKGSKAASAKGQHSIGESQPTPHEQTELKFQVGELERALFAKVVKKCGSRNYWDEWAKDIAKIAQTHISRITAIIEQGSVGVPPTSSDDAGGTPTLPSKEYTAFKNFANELRDDLNDSISDAEVIEMLAQHLITKPVFDSLFADYSFASHNPVSQAMQEVLDVLQEHRLSKEADTLEKFYESVARKAADTNTPEGKQKIVVELYDKFFRNAFPKMTERLGIVYTPVEIVDFIIHSINDLLQSEFGQTLGSKGVHIIDPFTGTGTFITRLLQSGLIKPEELPHKYKHEIHANEIVLLAYYIAAINIEAVYHGIMKEHRGPVSPLQGSDASGPDTRGVAPGWHVSPFQGGDVAAPTNDPTQQDGANAPTGQDMPAHGTALGSPPPDTPSPEGPTGSNAPTGQNIPAQGNALGSSPPDTPSPEGPTGSSAPTGQNIPAQGNALGSSPPQSLSPEGATYEPFEGICLTDTFQLYEKDDLISNLLTDNSDRRKRQKKLDIRVIMGNPPYSIGQGSENDNAANIEYAGLDERIRDTYAKESNATLQRSLYDSYVRAIRWASDRIGESGIIGFVTNGSFVEIPTTDGLRRCLENEFSSIYVVHLRGNQRTSGELSRKEGGKVFGSGSRAPIAITFLVKKRELNQKAEIYFYDIGDYLSREDKLQRILDFKSTSGISTDHGWQRICPDSHGSWINQRDESFDDFIAAGDKKGYTAKVFENYSLGVVTNRDAWCYNCSDQALRSNMGRMIEFYNSEVARFTLAYPGLDTKQRGKKLDDFIDTAPEKISWTRSLKSALAKNQQFAFQSGNVTRGLYRPFFKQWLYFDRRFNEMVYQMPYFFPEKECENIVIGVSASSSRSAFSVVITDHVPSLHAADMVGSQYFPLYLYEAVDDMPPTGEGDLFDANDGEPGMLTRRDAITDAGLAHFQQAYPGEGSAIGKEDLFYYIYGLLHSPEYRSRYADNLGKELPRIPAVKRFADFMAYSQAGRDLAHWHLNYESVAIHPGAKLDYGKKDLSALGDADYRVEKMKFAKQRDPETGKMVADKSVVIYNPKITIRNIPLEAYDYIVNGKPALEWVMERQSVTTDKKSGIVNDANLWATETMGDAKYPLELFLRVITVSLETNRIVAGLPVLEISVESPT